MLVESEVGKGTTLTFQLPNMPIASEELVQQAEQDPTDSPEMLHESSQPLTNDSQLPRRCLKSANKFATQTAIDVYSRHGLSLSEQLTGPVCHPNLPPGSSDSSSANSRESFSSTRRSIPQYKIDTPMSSVQSQITLNTPTHTSIQLAQLELPRSSTSANKDDENLPSRCYDASNHPSSLSCSDIVLIQSGQPNDAPLPTLKVNPVGQQPLAKYQHPEPFIIPSPMPSNATSTTPSLDYPTQSPAGLSSPFNPLHLLVVDDNQINRKVFRSLLTRMGHKVTLACDGVEAVEIFKQAGDQIDIILLDLCMRQSQPDIEIVIGYFFATFVVTPRELLASSFYLFFFTASSLLQPIWMVMVRVNKFVRLKKNPLHQHSMIGITQLSMVDQLANQSSPSPQQEQRNVEQNVSKG